MHPKFSDVAAPQTTTEIRFTPNSVVGARRWPQCASHPECWERPLQGTVLAIDDPRAWAGTIAFPLDEPGPVAVQKHVQWCREQGMLDHDVPVLWNTDQSPFVHWESNVGLHRLKPYDEDLSDWLMERAEALANIRRIVGGEVHAMAA